MSKFPPLHPMNPNPSPAEIRTVSAVVYGLALLAVVGVAAVGALVWIVV